MLDMMMVIICIIMSILLLVVRLRFTFFKLKNNFLVKCINVVSFLKGQLIH